DQLLMTRSLEDGDGQVLNTNVASEGDAAEVVGDRIIEVDRATRAGSGDELLHLGYRGQLREPSRLDRDQERDCVDVAARDLACALHRVDAQVDLAVAAGDHHAVRQVGLVPWAQDDCAGKTRAGKRAAHRVARRLADSVWSALAEESCAGERGRFSCVHELERNRAARPTCGN